MGFEAFFQYLLTELSTDCVHNVRHVLQHEGWRYISFIEIYKWRFWLRY
jgi:hypothetical protein